MDTENRQLHETLNQLHAQLGDAEGLNERSADELRQTLEQIRDVLEKFEARPGEERDDEPAMSERLADVAQQFEQSHPTLAGTVRGLVDMLAQMGI